MGYTEVFEQGALLDERGVLEINTEININFAKSKEGNRDWGQKVGGGSCIQVWGGKER